MLIFSGFWVVAFVIITAVFSCCGYYCSSTNDGYGGLVRRSSSFNMFRRFRRYSSIDESEAWKVISAINLLHYFELLAKRPACGTAQNSTWGSFDSSCRCVAFNTIEKLLRFRKIYNFITLQQSMYLWQQSFSYVLNREMKMNSICSTTCLLEKRFT